MFDYKGETCPYCKKQFVDGDDIVVCPDCGAPHHRACFSEHGKCAHSDQHGSYEWKSELVQEEKNDDLVYCPTCGRGNLEGSSFCSFCGSQINADRQPEIFVPQSVLFEQSLGDSLYGHPISDWKAYIGQNSYYYLYHMSRQEKTGSQVGFTLSAAFFPVVYFLYRRVWWVAGLAAAANLILSLPSLVSLLLFDQGLTLGLSLATWQNLATAAQALSFAISLACGFFAVTLFRRSAVKRMDRMRARCSSDDEYRALLAARGGPCSTALYIVFGIAAVSLLAASLFGPF